MITRGFIPRPSKRLWILRKRHGLRASSHDAESLSYYSNFTVITTNICTALFDYYYLILAFIFGLFILTTINIQCTLVFLCQGGHTSFRRLDEAFNNDYYVPTKRRLLRLLRHLEPVVTRSHAFDDVPQTPNDARTSLWRWTPSLCCRSCEKHISAPQSNWARCRKPRVIDYSRVHKDPQQVQSFGET